MQFVFVMIPKYERNIFFVLFLFVIVVHIGQITTELRWSRCIPSYSTLITWSSHWNVERHTTILYWQESEESLLLLHWIFVRTCLMQHTHQSRLEVSICSGNATQTWISQTNTTSNNHQIQKKTFVFVFSCQQKENINESIFCYRLSTTSDMISKISTIRYNHIEMNSWELYCTGCPFVFVIWLRCDRGLESGSGRGFG